MAGNKDKNRNTKPGTPPNGAPKNPKETTVENKPADNTTAATGAAPATGTAAPSPAAPEASSAPAAPAANVDTPPPAAGDPQAPAAGEEKKDDAAAPAAQQEPPAQAPAAQEPPATPPVVEPTPAAPAAVAAPTPPAATPPATPEPAAAEAEVTVHDHLKKLYPSLTELPANIKAIISAMDDYVAAMGPNTPCPEATGVMKQRALYNTVIGAIDSAVNHDIAIEAVLFYFHKYRAGAFSTRYLFRFLPNLKIDKGQMDAFQVILHIFQNGAERAGRDIRLKTIDFKKAVKPLSPTQAERLLSFFRVKG